MLRTLAVGLLLALTGTAQAKVGFANFGEAKYACFYYPMVHIAQDENATPTEKDMADRCKAWLTGMLKECGLEDMFKVYREEIRLAPLTRFVLTMDADLWLRGNFPEGHRCAASRKEFDRYRMQYYSRLRPHPRGSVELKSKPVFANFGEAQRACENYARIKLSMFEQVKTPTPAERRMADRCEQWLTPIITACDLDPDSDLQDYLYSIFDVPKLRHILMADAEVILRIQFSTKHRCAL